LVDLSELFKLFEIGDDLLSAGRDIDKRETFNRVEECLKKECSDQHEEIGLAYENCGILIRYATNQRMAVLELVTALLRVGIKIPHFGLCERLESHSSGSHGLLNKARQDARIKPSARQKG
jgi:hypothetical protein